jgi:hypothetical protein
MSSQVFANMSHEQHANANSMDRVLTEKEWKRREKELKEEMERKIWSDIARGHYTRNPEEYKIKFGLNKKGPQLDSKTAKALRSIAKMHHTHKINYPNKKLVSIVFTNNSLLEGAQWQSRTAAKFKGTDIVCQRLASDSIEKEKDFSKAPQLMAAFYTYSGSSKKQHLGDVLIMCNHHVRIEDIEKLIDVCAGNGKSARSGIEFRFNIFFDEYDKPKLRYQMMKFIKKMYKENLTYMINHIQLISGTTPSKIMKELTNIAPEAAKMLNIQKHYKEGGDALSDYKTILAQKFIPHEGPEDPINYVKSIDKKHFVPGKIYFIPSHWTTKKQEDMAVVKMFKEKGCWILIINGKNKELRSPLGEIIKINLKKRDKNGNTQELYNVLSKWRIEYPNAGLIITGNDCIERGLTFLTDGFCFDYMVISNYFRKDLYKLVQIGGRGQGGSKFVGDFTIIMSQALYDRMKKYIEDDEKLTNAEHEYYDQDLLAQLDEKKEPKSLNKNDIMFEDFGNENDAKERMNYILDEMKKVPEWEYREKRFIVGYKHIKNKKHNKKLVAENGFYKERCLGKDNVGKYEVYSLEKMRNTRGEHDSGQATLTYKTHICYEDVEDASTIRYVICYPKSHLDKIKEMENAGVEESKSGD